MADSVSEDVASGAEAPAVISEPVDEVIAETPADETPETIRDNVNALTDEQIALSEKQEVAAEWQENLRASIEGMASILQTVTEAQAATAENILRLSRLISEKSEKPETAPVTVPEETPEVPPVEVVDPESAESAEDQPEVLAIKPKPRLRRL